ncbi:MAG: hypothetical protein AAGE13_02915 [Pseudomonadota bacterium]
MSFETSFRRLRAQMHAMERTVRMMRLEVENALAGLGADGVSETMEVPSGLGRVLEGGRPIELQTMQPYAPFSDGVWISYDKEVVGTSTTVCTRGLARLGSGDRAPTVTRLSVHPVFGTVTEPLWVSLESEVDVARFSEAEALQLDFISHFDMNRLAKKPVAPNCSVMLRLTDSTGERRDVLTRFFPTTTMPLEQSIVYSAPQLREVQGPNIASVTMILMLPTSGDYVFNLDYFSLRATVG